MGWWFSCLGCWLLKVLGDSYELLPLAVSLDFVSIVPRFVPVAIGIAQPARMRRNSPKT